MKQEDHYRNIENLELDTAIKILKGADFKIYNFAYEGQGRVIVEDEKTYSVIVPDTAPKELLSKDKETNEWEFDAGSYDSIVAKVVQSLLSRVDSLEKEIQELKGA